MLIWSGGRLGATPAEPYALTPSRSAEGKGHIQISDLSFRYSPEHPFLYRNLNLALKPGKLTVLTGPSGCGKSTLAKLMLGFYQPTATCLGIKADEAANVLAHPIADVNNCLNTDETLLQNTNLKAEGLPEKYKVQGFPTLIIIDQQGIIRDIHTGFTPQLREDVVETVERLLRKN